MRDFSVEMMQIIYRTSVVPFLMPVAHGPCARTEQHFLSFRLHKTQWQPCWIYQDILNYHGKTLFPLSSCNPGCTLYEKLTEHVSRDGKRKGQKTNSCSPCPLNPPQLYFLDDNWKDRSSSSSLSVCPDKPQNDVNWRLMYWLSTPLHLSMMQEFTGHAPIQLFPSPNTKWELETAWLAIYCTRPKKQHLGNV